MQWHRTENHTAVLKARSVAQFRKVLKTKDLYPNLEYLQSTSVQKRRDHLPTRVVDKQLLHATREAKLEAGKTIRLEELLERCESDFLSIDEWRIDPTNQSFVTAVKYQGENKALKYVFRLVRDRKTNVYLLDFVTTGIVEETNIRGFKKIKET